MDNYVISTDELAGTIFEITKAYEKHIVDAVKDAAKAAVKEADREIKTHITFKEHSGDYVKSMATKKVYENEFGAEYVWYVKKPHYRLTHLLENGHATRNGGRTRKFPHIVYGAEAGNRIFEQRVTEAIKNG